MRTVSGLIVSRRCVGQSLSFVTVKESGTGAAWTLTFKPEPFDARLSGTPFPKRKADLRCGDEIVAHVVDQDGESCVVVWSSAGLGGGRPEGRLDREGQASLALTDEERAIGLCGEWALLGECTGNSCPVRRPPTIRSVRKVTLDLPLVRLQHRHAFADACERERTQKLRVRRDGEVGNEERLLLTTVRMFGLRYDAWALPVMERAPSKAARCEVFAAFLLERYRLDSSSLVIDVAGGSGELARCLAQLGVRVVTVDPRAAAPARHSADGSTGRNSVLAVRFESDFAVEHTDLADEASLFVGLHPDEATDAVVAVADSLRKPWAVVPCCVFWRANPQRKLWDGTTVRTTAQLCAWLLMSSVSCAEVHTTRLAFEGRNRVIYSTIPVASSTSRCVHSPSPVRIGAAAPVKGSALSR